MPGYWSAHSDRDFEDPLGLLDRDEDPWTDWDPVLDEQIVEQSGEPMTDGCPEAIRVWAEIGDWQPSTWLEQAGYIRDEHDEWKVRNGG